MYSGVRNPNGVKEESLRKYVPSIFATEPHSSRSEQYEFIPTWEVLQAMQKEGFRIVSAQQSRTRDISKREHTKHMLRLRHEKDIDKAAVVGDSVFELLFKNSHDGSSLYEFMGGLYRFVCANGMVIGDHLIAPVKVMHKGDVRDEAIEASYEVIGHAEKVNKYVEEWKRFALSIEDQQEFAKQAARLRFGTQHLPISSSQLLHARRADDVSGTLWSVYNRVQENCIKGGMQGVTRNSRGAPIRRAVRAIGGIDQDIRLNKGLWDLAEEFYYAKRLQKKLEHA